MLDLITLDSISQHKLIEGTIVRPLKVNSDESGILVETLKTNWTDVYSEVMPFAQQYYSVTNSGIARDENQWHFHPGGQQDRFIVISGEIVAAIADNEENSPTKGLLNLYHMKSRENPYLLVLWLYPEILRLYSTFRPAFMIQKKKEEFLLRRISSRPRAEKCFPGILYENNFNCL